MPFPFSSHTHSSPPSAPSAPPPIPSSLLPPRLSLIPLLSIFHPLLRLHSCSLLFSSLAPFPSSAPLLPLPFPFPAFCSHCVLLRQCAALDPLERQSCLRSPQRPLCLFHGAGVPSLPFPVQRANHFNPAFTSLSLSRHVAARELHTDLARPPERRPRPCFLADPYTVQGKM